MSDLTEADEGKPVVHQDETVGRVVTVEDDTVHVDPDPDLSETIKSQLGWEATDEDTYPIQEELIADITDDEIQLQSPL